MTETYVRTQVIIQTASADPPEDWSVHSVYHHHSDEAGTLGPFDPMGHATNVNNAFYGGTGGGAHPFNFYVGRKITTKVYSMMDMKPRPVLAEFVNTPTTWSSAALAPRELAMPLRYFADRNLVGQRGRLYLGPLTQSLMYEVIPATPALTALDLGHALAAIGSVQMSWCMHSERQDILNAPDSPGGTTTAAWHDITEIWVNDQWAHMESRQHVEATRWTASITPGLP